MQHKKTPGGQVSGHPPEGSNEAGKHPARIERYSTARKRALEMVAHLATQRDDPLGTFEKARHRLNDCGNYLLFHHYFTVGKMRLAAMKSCKQHLLCPLCAIRRGAKTLEGYLNRYEVIRAEHPTLRAFMVTFTVKNGDDLAERFGHLQKSLKTLHRRRRNLLAGVRSAPYTEAVKALGAVWSFEVTNRGKGWHPHAHAVWLAYDTPSQARLQQEWQDITGDSFIVDVRPIEGDPVEGFMEVLKYAVKFSDLTLADNVTAWEYLKGRRLLGSFGLFRGVQVPEAMTDELLDDLPYIELFYRYTSAGYSLQSHQEPTETGFNRFRPVTA